jgi:uncharacterized protein (DUF433 family)
MTLHVAARPAPIQVDAHGVARVGGTRVTLDSVVHAFREGASAEAIADRFDSLELADVYAVIAYCLQEPDSIEAYLHERSVAAQTLKEQVERRFPSNDLRQKLLTRRAARDTGGA